jgi:hypothetical protein
VLVGGGKRVRGSMMFVDHADPVRGRFGDDALSTSDFRQVYAKTGRFFARKFDPKRSPDIARAIAEGDYFTDFLASSDSRKSPG